MSVLGNTPRRRIRRPVTPTGPVGGLPDPRFAYTPALSTDIRKTFKRIQAQIAKGDRL